jgi:hypothetical protein
MVALCMAIICIPDAIGWAARMEGVILTCRRIATQCVVRMGMPAVMSRLAA